MIPTILAARSDFSLGESSLNIKTLVEAAKAAGQEVVGLTDTMSLTAMINFTKTAKGAGLRPIIGVRVRISDDPTWRPEKGEKKKAMPVERFLTVYPRTEAGLKMLFRLLTLGNSDERFYYTSKISFVDLTDHLATITPDDTAIVLGEMQGLITHPNIGSMVDTLAQQTSMLFVPLVPIDTPYFGRINKLSLDLCAGKGLEPIVIRPSLYTEGGADAQEILTGICTATKASAGYFQTRYNRDLHPMGLKDLTDHVKLVSKHLMQRGAVNAIASFSKGLMNADALVKAISYEWKQAEVSLPQMAPDEFVALKTECLAGWQTRFKTPIFGHTPTPDDLRDKYMPRLMYELDVLRRLKFAGYFLLVQDIVRFSKSNGILVGPGRGSVGGSLVAYLMGITECDPIRFGLLFERFINPDRIDLPDADLDFMSSRRHEVVKYIVDKYGEDRVAGVSNHSTLGTASVIRDVGRTLGISEFEYSISKFVPKQHGSNATLAESREQVSEIDAFATKYEEAWAIMETLEGTMRGLSQHAAGIVVAGEPLTERAVLERRTEGSVVCWDKDVVESQGLVKVDLLGLNTLDIIALATQYVKERHGKSLDLGAIPLEDPDVLTNFAKGLTNGIFQYEGGGAKRMLRDMAASGIPTTFEDVTAVSALNRPGPLEAGLDRLYISNRAGETQPEYISPHMRKALEPTFGAIVYQEQVMQIAKDLCGFTGAEADVLRKAIGKKDPVMMRKMEDKFISGGIGGYADVELADGTIQRIHTARLGDVAYTGMTLLNDGVIESAVRSLWNDILGFAAYSFNKSHSVEYCLISYQAMFLKQYYPVEFYAATMTLTPEDKLQGLIRDAKEFGIRVDMPDCNLSSSRFEIATDTTIVIPLQRIKGISEKSAEALMRARAAGPFTSKQDLINRVEKRLFNSRAQNSLDLVGGFASVEPSQVPANDPSRIRDQLELLPGLITANVVVDRDLKRDKTTKEYLGLLVDEYRAAHGPNGTQTAGMPVKPMMGKQARFMVVTDAPSRDEEAGGMFSFSNGTTSLDKAIDEAGFEKADAYWTGLVKVPKKGRQVEAGQVSVWLPYLLREIEMTETPVVVLLGSQTVRAFLPDFKGKASDEAGKVVYDKVRNLNLVIGFNPGEIYHAPEKQANLVAVFAAVSELIA